MFGEERDAFHAFYQYRSVSDMLVVPQLSASAWGCSGAEHAEQDYLA
jgi:hypothetical protein